MGLALETSGVTQKLLLWVTSFYFSIFIHFKNISPSHTLSHQLQDPVVLLEGRWKEPPSDFPRLVVRCLIASDCDQETRIVLGGIQSPKGRLCQAMF